METTGNKIINILKEKNLLKRVYLKSIHQNQEGYYWLTLRENYYNYTTAEKVSTALKGLSGVYIWDYNSLRETQLNTKNYYKNLTKKK